jgi:WD40 repeat protein
MDPICSVNQCQHLADILCECLSVPLCETHALGHFLLPGKHKVAQLRLRISSEMHLLLSSKLSDLAQAISSVKLRLRKDVKETTERIYQAFRLSENRLSAIHQQCISVISSYRSIEKVAKSTTDYFEGLLIGTKEAIVEQAQAWRPPSVEVKPIDEYIKINDDCIPFTFSSSPRVSAVAAVLKSMNNKIKLFGYAQSVKESPDDQKALLQIIKSTAYSQEFVSVAYKALTVLSKANFDFSHMNLQGVNVLGAEIIGGKFIGTNFRESNFKQVKLNLMVLSRAVLDFHVLRTIESGHFQFEGHFGRINALRFSADGKFLISASEDCTIRLWEVRSGHCLNVLEGHADEVMCVDISADTLEIVSGGKDGLVRLWDISTGICIGTFTKQSGVPLGLVFSVLIINSKQLIVAGTWTEEVLVWSHDSQLLRVFSTPSPVWALSTPFSANSDGSITLFVGTRNGELIAFKTTADKPLWTYPKAHTQWISQIILSRSGKKLVTTGCDGMIKAWKSSESGKFFKGGVSLVREVKAYENSVFHLQTTPGRLFSLADNTVKCWYKMKLQLLDSLKLEGEAGAFAVNQNGSTIAYSQTHNIHLTKAPDCSIHN